MMDIRYAKPWKDGSAIDCNVCARFGKARCTTIKMRPDFNLYNWQNFNYGHIFTAGHMDAVARLIAEEESKKKSKKATAIGSFFKATSDKNLNLPRARHMVVPQAKLTRSTMIPQRRMHLCHRCNPQSKLEYSLAFSLLQCLTTIFLQNILCSYL